MNPQDLLSTFIQQLDALSEVIETSHYLAREERIKIKEEIDKLSLKFKEGTLTPSEGENWLKEIENQTALGEIRSLATKIGGLNPSSPRLASLRMIGERVASGALTAGEARQAIYDLMHER